MSAVVDARDRFARAPMAAAVDNLRAPERCRDCPQPGATLVLPHVDHRRRKPWPQPYWLCPDHARSDR